MATKIFIYKDHTGASDVIKKSLVDQMTNYILLWHNINGESPCELVIPQTNSAGSFLDNEYCRYCYEVVPRNSSDKKNTEYTQCRLNAEFLKAGFSTGGYTILGANSGEVNDNNWKTAPKVIFNDLQGSDFGVGNRGLGESIMLDWTKEPLKNYDMLFIDFTVVKVTASSLILAKDNTKKIANPLLATNGTDLISKPMIVIDNQTKRFSGYLHS